MSKFIAYLALSTHAALSADRIAQDCRVVCGSAPADIAVAAASLPKTGKGCILIVNGVEVLVMEMSEPLPADAYMGAARNSLVWKEAESAFEGNKAHAVVATLQAASSHAEALAGAFAVTVVAAAVSQLVDTVGIVFMPAETAFPPRDLQQMAVNLAQKREIPEMLWCSLAFVPGETMANGNPKVGAVATGLFPFIGRDLEFTPMPWPPGEVARRVLGLAQYLILNGPVIKDGDSVGNAPDEKLVARLSERGRWLSYPVLAVSEGQGS